MIRIRNRPSAPKSLKSRQVNAERQRIADIVNERGSIASKDFDGTYWRKADVRNALWVSQRRKCCFCENKRAKKREFDAEHFRPKAGVTGEDHIGYWWLAYKWDNLLYACKPCNQEYKKNQFPLLNNDQRAQSPADDLNIERPLLVNPINEDPEEFIGFDWQQAYGIAVKATGLDPEGRGNETIKIVGLNSDELVDERAELTQLLEDTASSMKMARQLNNPDLVNELSIKIRDLTSSQKRFTGFRRAFFRGHGLGQYVAND